MYCGYVTTLKNVNKHPNADRLQIGECFGNHVIVSLDYREGQLGVYFPVDGQLGERFCQVNDLVRRKDPETGKDCGGYLDPVKRNIKALRLRGEQSDGLFMPLSCLTDFTKISDLKDGDTVTIFNGEEICRKYIPRSNHTVHAHGEKAHKQKVNFAPTFYEHIDTPQLAYNLNAFKNGDVIELTLKMHGTSGRTGYLPLIRHKQTLLDKIFHRAGKQYQEYGYVTGTRRVVLDETHTGGFYADNGFRNKMADKFTGKLRKGEVAYYEIVGFQGSQGAPIMSSVKNSKISDKAFTKQYGEETVFSYGCNQWGGYAWDTQDSSGDVAPCCEVYVYRMTMVNEDGDVVEYTPDQMRYRCEQMGIKTVPVFERFIIPDMVQLQDDVGSLQAVDAGEYVVRKVEQYFDGPDPVGKTHVREGVVARIVSAPSIAVYKHKNFSFKVLSNLAVDTLTDEQISAMDEDILSEM